MFNYNDTDLTVVDCHIPTLGSYQVENAVLAIKIIEKLAARDGFSVDPHLVQLGLAQAHIPGRSEVQTIKGKTVMFDGAHNPQKMQALIESINQLDLEKKPIWVFGAKKDKDISRMLEIVLPNADKIITPSFFMDNSNDHLRTYAISADKLRDMAITIDKNTVTEVMADPKAALSAAIDQSHPDQMVIVAGSIYLIGDLHRQ